MINREKEILQVIEENGKKFVRVVFIAYGEETISYIEINELINILKEIQKEKEKENE